MEENKIRSGLALVRDVSLVMSAVAKHAATSSCRRVLVVFLGDDAVKSSITQNRNTLLVQFSNKNFDAAMTKYYIPVCLKKGCRETSGLIQAVLSLLLPLGYKFDPSLVLLVRTSDCGVSDGAWQQLIGLTQGLAQGHALVIMQDSEESSLAPTVSSLLGTPAPPLGPPSAAPTEDAEAVEKLRHKLQADWKLLQTIISEKQSGADG